MVAEEEKASSPEPSWNYSSWCTSAHRRQRPPKRVRDEQKAQRAKELQDQLDALPPPPPMPTAPPMPKQPIGKPPSYLLEKAAGSSVELPVEAAVTSEVPSDKGGAPQIDDHGSETKAGDKTSDVAPMNIEDSQHDERQEQYEKLWCGIDWVMKECDGVRRAYLTKSLRAFDLESLSEMKEDWSMILQSFADCHHSIEKAIEKLEHEIEYKKGKNDDGASSSQHASDTQGATLRAPTKRHRIKSEG